MADSEETFVEILSFPGHSHPKTAQSKETGPVCRNLKAFHPKSTLGGGRGGGWIKQAGDLYQRDRSLCPV